MGMRDPMEMDIRKIQITGGSSYMITLPKDWAEGVGLKKNDPVGLQPQSDGSLIVYPGGKSSTPNGMTRNIDVDEVTDGNLLYRMLVGAYIAGHDTIVLESGSSLPSAATSVAASFTQVAIGLEIMEESDTRIVIKDLLDRREMRPSKSVERMTVLVRNMLTDTLDGLERKDSAILGRISDRDREVDRIDWLISRQVNIHQRDVTLSRRMGMDLCEISRCSSISHSLERIGDHAVLLASNLGQLLDDPTSLDSEILSTGRDVVRLMVDSVRTWSDKDMIAANSCIGKGESLVERALEISEMVDALPGKSAIAAELIAGSVRRVAEYSMDIAEVAINAAMEGS